MAKLRAVIIGAGLIAGKKHIPAFVRLRRKVELVALCDIHLEAAEALASRFGVPRVYSDFSAMLSAEKPDLVDICTPPQTHARLAVEAIKHGCHVLIEKPMALTVGDCDAIVSAAREAGVKVCVAHSDLFYPPFQKARELVAAGKIGTFRGMRIFLSTPTGYMTSQKDHWAHRLPGGVIGETGPHAVYLSLAFLRNVKEVSVEAMKLLDYPWSPFEDYRINLIGENGVSSITLSYATDQWSAQVDVLGEKAILRLDLEGMTLILQRRTALKPFLIGYSLASEWAQLFWNMTSNAVQYVSGRLRSTHELLIDRFVESIRNGLAPPVSAEEGRETVRVLNMIVEKLRKKYG
jgi:predicted dehydrogenase